MQCLERLKLTAMYRSVVTVFVSKTRDELERNFVEAFERLVRANAAYDQGHWSDTPNIAKETFNFVHDRGRLVSLLTHLDLKAHTQFLSTAKARRTEGLPPGAVLASPEYRLINACIGFDGMGYEPLLGRVPSLNPLLFDQWYDETVLAWYGREDIKRGEIIEFIRHVEGGGHVAGRFEPRWDKKMMDLIRGEWVDGYMRLGNGPAIEPEPYAPAYATMRQIGWELEETLRRGCHSLISRANFAPAPGPRMRPARSEIVLGTTPEEDP